MAELTPILRDIRGVYSDRGRDRLPDGSVWEMVDWVPEIMQAGARMRGAWVWKSLALPNAIDGMLYAPYRAGAQLLVANGSSIHRVSTSVVDATLIGAIPATRQNPVFWQDLAVVLASDGVTKPTYVSQAGAITAGPASSSPGRYGVVWKSRLVVANSNAFPYRVVMSTPGDPTAAIRPWNTASYFDMPLDVTGLAQQATQILVFHESSVTRLRGTTPPDTGASPGLAAGDIIQDTLYDRAGCYDARSIAYWQQNVLFCDARGIHLTDGAATRNLTSQGGVMNLWRSIWERPGGTPPLSVAGTVHYDYYLVTIRHSGFPAATFVVDLATRRPFMLSNIDSTAFAFALGARERLFGVDTVSKRVTDLTPMFDPDSSVLQVDANGVSVLPVISTAWMRLSKEPAFKRIVDLHLGYEAYVTSGDPDVFRLFYVNAPTGADQTLGEFKKTTKFIRRKLPVRRRLEGVGFKLTQLVPTTDSRIYDLSLRAYAEEDQHL